MTILPHVFFARPAPEVAPDLVGRILVCDTPSGERLAGRIVEVEAYAQDDPAWYGWGILDVATGLLRPTGRGLDLFGCPGMAYLHLSYGLHWMLNAVTEPEGRAGCVLIRAVEPIEGLDTMWGRRPAARTEKDLANGPGKLTQAFGIDARCHRKPLTKPPLYIARGESDNKVPIARSSRIGVRHGTELQYRFFLRGHPCVSRRHR